MNKSQSNHVIAVSKSGSISGPANQQSKTPSAEELASMINVQIKGRMSTEEIRRLRKPLPGYASLLLDAATQIEADGELLGLRGISAEGLQAVHAEQRASSTSEAIAEKVFRAAYEQRMQVDDRAIDMLLKIARRVQALAEDEPDLLDRWAFLIDFLSTFRTGRVAKPAEVDPKP